jgi:hypothetical protein
MKIQRIHIAACCGRTATIFRTDEPLTTAHITALEKHGFKETPHFTKAGILYMDNPDFNLSGPIGSDRLTVNCRHADCTQKMNDLEELLQHLE